MASKQERAVCVFFSGRSFLDWTSLSLENPTLVCDLGDYKVRKDLRHGFVKLSI